MADLTPETVVSFSASLQRSILKGYQVINLVQSHNPVTVTKNQFELFETSFRLLARIG